MLRSMSFAAVGFLVFAGTLLAETPAGVKGIVKDVDKEAITIKVDDKDQVIKLTDDTKFVDENGKALDSDKRKEQLVPGAQVTITTTKNKQNQNQQVTVQVQTIRVKKKQPEPPPVKP